MIFKEATGTMSMPSYLYTVFDETSISLSGNIRLCMDMRWQVFHAELGVSPALFRDGFDFSRDVAHIGAFYVGDVNALRGTARVANLGKIARHISPGEVEISFCVPAQYRLQYIGFGLLRAAELYAQEHFHASRTVVFVPKIFSERGTSANRMFFEARRFLERNGYERKGVVTVEKIDCYSLSKPL